MPTRQQSVLSLQDARLFRQACYVDGAWTEARRRSIEVDNPATGEIIGTVPKLGPRRDASGDRRGVAGVSGVAAEDRQGARRGRCAGGSS